MAACDCLPCLGSEVGRGVFGVFAGEVVVFLDVSRDSTTLPCGPVGSLVELAQVPRTRRQVSSHDLILPVIPLLVIRART